MNVEIHAHQLVLSDSAKDRIRDRVSRGLARFDERVRAVHAWLSDENGPKGGVDAACRIQVQLVGANDVVIEERHSKAEGAVALAVGRMRRAVQKSLGRELQKRR